MATKDLTVVRSFPYGTRMLKAGDSLTVSGPMARVLVATGRATEAAARAPVPQPVPIIPTVDEVLGAEVVAPKKAAPRKAATKRAAGTRKKAAAKR